MMMGLMTPNKTKPLNGGDADFGGGVRETENVRERREEPPQADFGGGVRETENVRERREEPPQVLGFREKICCQWCAEKRQWWCNGFW